MKVYNNYGTVYKLKGKRRAPWVARVIVGHKVGDNGKNQAVYQYLGYFQTQREARECLAEYNSRKTPHGRRITLGALWGEYLSEKQDAWESNTIRAKVNAWRILEPLSGFDINKLTVTNYEELFEESGKNAPQLQQVKTLINGMYKYAVKKQYTTPDYAAFIKFTEVPKKNPNAKEHKRIPREVINELWTRADETDVQTVLFLIYSGLRVGEFINLLPEDVHIEERWLEVRKAKTPAGTGRIVPIAEKVAPFIESWLKLGYRNVAPYPNIWRQSVPVNNYRHRFEKLMPGYRPHDARYTCVSELAELKTPVVVIRSIVGHKDENVTEHYTKIALDVKLDYINQIE